MSSNGNGSTHKSEYLRVLIADDVMETRRSTRLMMSLVPNSRVVAIAQNGREAIQMVQRHQPDVVLMDLNMPEMDGLRAIELIRKYSPHTGCIVVSAERRQDLVARARELGVLDYLIKPFTSDQLITVLQEARRQVVKVEKPRPLPVKTKKSLKIQLAEEYIKSTRTDIKAMNLFEELAQDPCCPIRYMRTLALIYVFRQEWQRLKFLARHMETRE